LSLSVREQNADFDAAVFERIKCGQSCNAIRFNKSTLGAAPLGRPQKGIAQLGVRPVYKYKAAPFSISAPHRIGDPVQILLNIKKVIVNIARHWSFTV
jgi:hypothetical protein